MKKIILTTTIGVLSFIVFLTGCAERPKKVESKMLMPARVNLRGYYNVAVLDFEGDEQIGKNISRWLEGALVRATVDDKPYFKVITRSQLNRVMEEQRIQMTGLTDPVTSNKIGKIAGIDAIISGIIDAYDIEDGYYKEERTRYVKKGDKKVKEVYTVRCTERRAYVSFTINFIGVETGNVEISEPVGFEKKANVCGGARNTQLPPRSQILKQCAQNAIYSFIASITPHYVSRTLTLKMQDDESNQRLFKGVPILSKMTKGSSVTAKGSEEEKEIRKKVNGYIKNGGLYAEQGDWGRALTQYQKAFEIRPQSAAVNYNIGVVYEIRGELYKAKEYYEKAADLRSDRVYTEAVTHIEERILSAEKAKSQLR